MPTTPSALRYDAVAKGLHWTIALLVFVLLAMGKLSDVDAEDAPGIFAWHTGLGLVVLGLMAARVAWRLGHAVPPQPAGTPPWQARVAVATHHAFYLLLFALPLTGWMLTSVEGDAVTLFGIVDVPAWPLPRGEEAEDFLEETHEILGNIVMLLAGLHVLGGLKHHFVDRDDVLRRMLPFTG